MRPNDGSPPRWVAALGPNRTRIVLDRASSFLVVAGVFLVFSPLYVYGTFVPVRFLDESLAATFGFGHLVTSPARLSAICFVAGVFALLASFALTIQAGLVERFVDDGRDQATEA